ELCCDARRASLWTALTAHPNLAARILSLQLTDEPVSQHSASRVIVPRSLGARIPMNEDACYAGPTHCRKNCADVLASAIATMRSLQRFSWDQTTFLGLHTMEPVFRALRRHCPHLRALEIEFVDRMPSFQAMSAPLWKFENLTRISISVYHAPLFGFAPFHYAPNMFEMLGGCPHLTHLRLAIESGARRDISGFLTDPVWPDLKRLVIEGELTFASPAIVTAFLARHSQLEVLALPAALEMPLLPALPNLRWLHTPELLDDVSAATPAHLPRL
ncbi:hypothetical protein FB451DRAFT_1241748, partial [Mycena latifolia]